MSKGPTSQREYWFIFLDDQLLLFNQHEFEPLQADLVAQLKPFFLKQYHLGMFNQASCFCAELKNQAELPEFIHLMSLKKAFTTLAKEWYGIAAKAALVLHWDKNHQFCGRCGNLTTLQIDTFERVCSHCGLSFHPRISPSIIVLIKKGDQLLMARSPHFPPGAYALIAGFVEVGESIEEAIHREVKEEVNITIKNLCYFGSQSWPFPDSLMLGFMADYASGEIKIDHHEIEAADWYKFDNLPGRPTSSISIATEMIDYFVAEQQALSKS